MKNRICTVMHRGGKHEKSSEVWWQLSCRAEQFKKVGDIIRSDESRRYVVPSAPGKRFDGDIKVTDMLYECYRAAEKGEKIAGKIKKIQARYQEIIDGLGLDLKLDEQFAEIEKNFIAQAGSDYAASRGEFLNGIVMANYLGYTFVDPAECIFFEDNGNLDDEMTYKSWQKDWKESIMQ